MHQCIGSIISGVHALISNGMTSLSTGGIDLESKSVSAISTSIVLYASV